MEDREKIEWTFGTLEAVLSDIHNIADTKRTAFQARLKNFHRLNWPLHFESAKGKTTLYGPAHIYQMAIAVELTQLGIPPDRAVRILSRNFYALAMAGQMAARSLQDLIQSNDEAPNPSPMFLYFDPCALDSLTGVDLAVTPDLDAAADSFFYGGLGVVQDNLSNWTNASSSRISMVNVTTLLSWVISSPTLSATAHDEHWQAAFLEELAESIYTMALDDEGNAEMDAILDAIMMQVEAGKLIVPDNIAVEALAALIAERFEFEADVNQTAAEMLAPNFAMGDSSDVHP